MFCIEEVLMALPIIKTLIIGESCVGKKTFVTKHLTGKYESQEVKDGTSLPFKTNLGNVVFELYVRTFEDPLPDDIDAYIVMFDLTTLSSIHSIHPFIDGILWKTSVVVCGTKMDRAKMTKRVHALIHSTIKPFGESGVKYYDISSKSGYNYEKPFLSLMRSFLDDSVFMNGATLLN